MNLHTAVSGIFKFDLLSWGSCRGCFFHYINSSSISASAWSSCSKTPFVNETVYDHLHRQMLKLKQADIVSW